MFDIGFGEMLLLGSIALIAIGPKQLPEVMRTLGRFLNAAKKVGGEFQRNLSEAAENPARPLFDAQKTWEKVSSEVQTITQLQTDVRAVAAKASNTLASAQATAEAPISHGDGHDPNQLPLKTMEPVALDEHRQLSFDLEKNES